MMRMTKNLMKKMNKFDTAQHRREQYQLVKINHPWKGIIEVRVKIEQPKYECKKGCTHEFENLPHGHGMMYDRVCKHCSWVAQIFIARSCNWASNAKGSITNKVNKGV